MRLPGGEASLFAALLTLSTSLSLSVTAVSTLHPAPEDRSPHSRVAPPRLLLSALEISHLS